MWLLKSALDSFKMWINEHPYGMYSVLSLNPAIGSRAARHKAASSGAQQLESQLKDAIVIDSQADQRGRRMQY